MKLENTNFTMTYTFYKKRIDQIRNRWAWMAERLSMLFIFDDVSVSHGFQKQATYALLLGFITFVLMEKCV